MSETSAPTIHEPKPRQQQLRGDIEGLRAIAVGTVVLYHMGLSAFGGGFAGVDVFFVISGFLITLQLIKECDRTGTVSILRFYARRARRLLPAASVVLLFVGAVGLFLWPRSQRGDLGIDIFAAAGYVVNWVLAGRAVDYLNNQSDELPSLVQHYWSLSVEEQFYLVWPALILLGLWLARRFNVTPRRVITAILATAIVASVVHSVVYTATEPGMAYFVTTTRVWELGLGAIVALAARRLSGLLPRLASEMMAGVGVVLVCIGVVLFSSQTPWPGSAALLPTVGAALVIAAGVAHQSTVTARLLGVAPMRWIGGISYSIYLWHWPLFMLLDHLRPYHGLRGSLVTAAASIALAWLTRKLVEDPVRFHPRIVSSSRNALIVGAVGMAITMAMGGVVHMLQPRLTAEVSGPGITQRQARQADARGAVAFVDVERSTGAEIVPRSPLSDALTVSGPLIVDPAAVEKDIPRTHADNCQMGAATHPNMRCHYGKVGSKKRIVLFGDSKAGQWFSTLEAIALREGWELELHSLSACAAESKVVRAYGRDFTECLAWSTRVLEYLEKDPPMAVFYSQGRPIPVAEHHRLTDRLRRITDAGSQLFFISDSYPIGSAEECLEQNADDYRRCTYPQATGGRGDPIMRKVAQELRGQGVTYLDMNAWVCPKSFTACPHVVGRVAVVRHGSHISNTFAIWAAPIMHRMLIKEGLATAEPMPWT